tara:strand:- start:404 stop:1132 length:729 start_codon:yes stop_codon:yes gene_type:complete
MKINTALILCAGFGKRLNPLTLNTPKPLLEINNLTLLEKTINLIKNLGITKIKLNTFYLKDKIQIFLKKKRFNVDIEIIEDGDEILGTGGGLLNMIKRLPGSESEFLVFNPDTIWDPSYIKTINEMIKFYYANLNRNTLMIVNKNLSYDKDLKGDFTLFNKDGDKIKNLLGKSSENNFIFTGCQIINTRLFENFSTEPVKNFSMSKIWKNLMNFDNLFGFESKNKFYHVSNLEIYNKLLKDY